MSEEKVGLANPYALAEIAVGRKVNWKAVHDPDTFVGETFGVPIDELLAPTAGNLLVAGAAASQKAFAEIQGTKLDKRAEAFSVMAKSSPAETLFSKLSSEARARVIEALCGGVEARAPAGPRTGGGASATIWFDPGAFFNEAPEFFDPCQGGIGDCYFIAALCAVAWARPYVIVQRSRSTSAANPEFVDRIIFYSGGKEVDIEVTEKLPMIDTTHVLLYARSSEAGEIWPGVYEKAFAKWKTNSTTDTPDYSPIAGGWPVQASMELTNLSGTTKTCSGMTEDQIWSAIRSNCMSYRTFNPMTAWTYCTNNPPVNYAGTGIHGFHAYTVLGWAFVQSKKYVVIRNPWGTNGAVINALVGNWSAYDVSFWRGVPLNSGGVFAIPIDTFKKYYWQFGWVS